MGFYSRLIVPAALDWVMSGSTFSEYRRSLLANISGTVLEIGVGTGLNLAHYPETVTHLTTIDVNPGMSRRAQARLAQLHCPTHHQVLNSETLPMGNNTFDHVVSTWTLCSIAQVSQALAEIYRVLKPGGQFHFIEHGLSDRPAVQIWQHRLTPLQKRIADGCHLDRPIQALIARQFATFTVEQFVMPDFPAVAGYTYKGVATK
ncbi:MAG: class I SAM-dependent methyltransferase [Spirulina sp. SIO3F2]|nr:class I SAM-dependent methyltransferase [Spirulina sp. SIO3F2]